VERLAEVGVLPSHLGEHGRQLGEDERPKERQDPPAAQTATMRKGVWTFCAVT